MTRYAFTVYSFTLEICGPRQTAGEHYSAGRRREQHPPKAKEPNTCQSPMQDTNSAQKHSQRRKRRLNKNGRPYLSDVVPISQLAVPLQPRSPVNHNVCDRSREASTSTPLRLALGNTNHLSARQKQAGCQKTTSLGVSQNYGLNKQRLSYKYWLSLSVKRKHTRKEKGFLSVAGFVSRGPDDTPRVTHGICIGLLLIPSHSHLDRERTAQLRSHALLIETKHKMGSV